MQEGITYGSEEFDKVITEELTSFATTLGLKK